MIAVHNRRRTLASVLRDWWQRRTWIRAERKEKRRIQRAEKAELRSAIPVNWNDELPAQPEMNENHSVPLFPQLQISPNPFIDQLDIQFSFDRVETLQFQLLNFNGQQISQRKFETVIDSNRLNWHLNTTQIAEGFYYLRIIDAKGRLQTKALFHTGQ